MARARSTITRVSESLSRSCTSVTPPAASIAAELGQIVPAGHLRIDNGVAAQIERRINVTFALRHQRGAVERVAPHREFPTAKLPGPRARAAATSPATPIAISAAAVAFHASGSTASAAPTSAEAAQPIAVTRAISGSPLAMVASRVPSRTKSRSPVSPTTVLRALASMPALNVGQVLGVAADSAANSAALSRIARGFFADQASWQTPRAAASGR